MIALARFAHRRPRPIVAFWLVIIGVAAALAMNLPDAMKAGGFNDPHGEAALAQQSVDRAFHEAPNSLQIVLHDPDEAITTAAARARTTAQAFEHVQDVQGYQQHASWLSADKHTTFLQVGFKADNTTTQNLVPTLREDVVRAVGDDAVEVNVTGAPALDYALNVQSAKDATHAELIAFPLLFVVLFLVFRSVAAMLVPLVLSGVSLVISHAIGFLFTKITDVSILFTNVVSLIGLAVAIDYSLFIIKRYREELAEGGDVRRSLERAMATAGHSVLFSGLAVVVALSSLFIPGIMIFSSVALAGVIVTMVSLAVTITLLPAVLRLLGHKIGWGSLPVRQRRFAGTKAGDEATSRTSLLSRIGQAPGLGSAGKGRRRSAVLLLVLVAGFLALAAPMSGIRLQVPVASASILPPGTDARVGLERIKSDLALRDLFPVQLVLRSPATGDPTALLEATRSATQLAQAQPQVTEVRAVTELGLPANALSAAIGGENTSTGDRQAAQASLPAPAKAALGQLWAEQDGQYVTRVLAIPAGAPDTVGTHNLVKALRDKLPSTTTDEVQVAVTGATAQGVDFDNVIEHNIPVIVTVVALATLLLLAIAFHSLLLPLIALAFNALVVSGSLGVLTLVFQSGRHEPINSVTPLLLFAIMFGLSMDYMVIMMSRMRELYLAGNSHTEAVTEGLRRTAGLVNGAAIIMIAVFASFGTAKISIVQQLGLGLAVAIALDAFVIRLLVMPASLHLIGERVWGRRAHAQVQPQAVKTMAGAR
jgi:putative drug exporter of the RND superfamily